MLRFAKSFRRSVSALLFDRSAEIDEKAVLITVIVLGALAGLSAVAAKIVSLLDGAAAGL